MIRPAIIAVFVLAGALGSAEAESTRRMIQVDGSGTTSARPDIALITIGVQSAGKQAGEVLAANSKATSDVLTMLKSDGIAASDLQTSDFSVRPQTEADSGISSSTKNADNTPKIDGYIVSNTVTVTLRDVPKLGEILDKSVAAGANSIDGIQFIVSNPSPFLDDARRAAFADARRKAEIYANAANLKLGKLTSLSEGGGGVQTGALYQQRAKSMSAPIESGESALSVSVSAAFDLDE